ncbi:MAG: DoxX family protein [Candidatus Rariloculaceae bacterium]
MSGLISNLENSLSKWKSEIHGVLRITSAYMFMLHGTQKMFGFPVEAYSEFVLLSLVPGFIGVLEVFGGALLLVGLFTRPVAFVLSGSMAFAYWMAHAEPLFNTRANGGEAAALYCFLFLFFAAAGAGGWSLDNRQK